MSKISRRLFLVGCGSLSAARAARLPLKTAQTRRVLTLVYDKSLGMMRAIDRVVP